MKNVVNMFDNSNATLANKDVIETLEELLEQAKEGKAVNFGYIMVDENTQMTYGYVNQYLTFTMIGGFAYLNNLIIENGNN